MAFWRLLWSAVAVHAVLIGLDLDSAQYRLSVFEGKGAEVTETIRDRVERSTCLELTSENRTFEGLPRGYADFLKGDMACGYFAYVRSEVGSGEVSLETWKATEDGVGLPLNGHFWLSEELLAMLFDHISQTLQSKYPSQALDYALSVPSYWSQAQRRTVLQIADIANMRVVGLVDRVTAAALSYGHSRHSHMRTHFALFFNLGRDAVEVAVAKYADKHGSGSKDKENVTILGKAYTRDFSSAALDRILALHFATEFEKSTHVQVTNDKEAMTRLLFKANTVKKALLTADQVSVIENKLKDGKNFKYVMGIAELKELLKTPALDIVRALDEALAEAKVAIKQISDLVLIGNEAKSSALQGLVQDYLGAKLPTHIQDEGTMAKGAAVFAGNFSAQFPQSGLWLADFSKLPVQTECVSLEHGKFSSVSEVFPAKTRLGSKKELTLAYDSNIRCQLSLRKEESSKPSLEIDITGVEELSWKPEHLLLTFEYSVSGIMSLLKAKAFNSALSAPLNVTIRDLEFPGSLTSAQLERTKAHLQILGSKDEQNKAKSSAKSQLQLALKSYQALLKSADFVTVTSAEELERLRKAVLETEEWSQSEAERAAESFVYVEKLQQLRSVFREPQERHGETKTRPAALKAALHQLKSLNSTLITLNNTRSWLSQEEIKSVFLQLTETKDWLEQVEKEDLADGKMSVKTEEIQRKMRGIAKRVDGLRKDAMPRGREKPEKHRKETEERKQRIKKRGDL